MSKEKLTEVQEQALAALQKLDPENDDHWNTAGAPQMEALLGFMPEGTKFTRGELLKVAPGFTRKEAAKLKADLEDGGGVDEDKLKQDDESQEGDDLAETKADDKEPEPKPESEPKKKADNRDVYDNKIKELNSQRAENNKRIDRLKGENDLIEKQVIRLEEERNELYPPLTPAQNIKQYLASEQKLREERVLGAQGKAPIDQSLERRKPGLGTTRPQVPLTK